MKKIFSLLLVSTFLMGTTAFADTFKVENNNAVVDMELSPVNVTYNGISIDKRTPSVIYNERTLLPLRVLSEATGATVEWIPETKGIVIHKGSKKIELNIGSTTVRVNGVSKPITYEVPPMLINDNTLVPLRFISEEIGLGIDWDAESFTAIVNNSEYVAPSTVSGVSKEYVNGREAIVIRTSRAGLSRVTSFNDRLAIDFINSNFGFQKETSLSHSSVYRVRASQYSDKGVYNTDTPITRVVLDMNSGVSSFNYEIDRVDNNLVVYIDAQQTSRDPDQVASNQPGQPSTSDKSGSQAVSIAKNYLGVPYVWGGTTPNGFDCSGFVQYVYAQMGIKIPRVTTGQEYAGVDVTGQSLQPGDLVFWGARGNTHHVGMYIGSGKYIESPKPGDVVKISTLGSYTVARRIIN